MTAIRGSHNARVYDAVGKRRRCGSVPIRLLLFRNSRDCIRCDRSRLSVEANIMGEGPGAWVVASNFG